MRLHQWAKNLLVFVPLILAGKTESLEDTFLTLVAEPAPVAAE